MKDIVPELLASIEADFQSRKASNSLIRQIEDLIKSGAATYKEANAYAVEIGRILADVFKDHLTADVLPDGRMYFNIAERILNATLDNNHELIATVTASIQTNLNRLASMQINGVKAKLNQDRIDGIVERLVEADNFDDIKWILGEPVVNFSQAIVDDTAEANVKFHARLGLAPKIIRKTNGQCCDWCTEIAGEYVYPNVPDDIYRRHRHCDCTVEYFPGDGRIQNVHSKRWR